jgi:hypothetical protein
MTGISHDSDKGFSLVEAVIATGILTTGLLSLAGIMTLGLRQVAASSPSLIAREKAREAVESVHTARDTGTLSWAKIKNAGGGGTGVFLTGEQPLKTPGVDGLVNTADDAYASLEELRTAGPDGILGNTDDIRTPLTDYTREVLITDMMLDGTTTVNPNLRKITVIVKYKVGGMWRSYTLTTYVSSFS